MNVLIADDDEGTRFLLELYCRGEPFDPIFVGGGRAALQRFAEGDIDVVVTDVRMPDVTGEDILAEVKRRAPETPVLLMTAEPTIDDAVRFLKRGADDYIQKPVEQQVFTHRVRTLLERVRLAREVRELRNSLAGGGTPIIGNTQVLQTLLRRLPMTAQTDATVLLTGESGTGKEVFARRIHELSKRRSGRFVAVNCGALSDTLLESELFGYKRGAFTDAQRDTPGLVVEAESGTLFLDEIGEVSPAVQVKMLRFLQLKEYKPLGSPKSEKADVRIVVATNRDLRTMVQEGKFREDLYYRLNIVPITIPPLRDRKEDIPLLASFFLNNFKRQYGKKASGFSPEAFARLVAYDWPGNVRELENRVQQLVVLSNEEIINNLDLDESGGQPLPRQGSFKEEKKRVVGDFERDYVQRTIRRAEGNLSEAARLAGLDRKSFWLLAKRNGVRAGKS
ncbi:MAG: sigma-54 dependent transcriptional regulator [Deltaproteobacteria bacterium]|nr:sigma-54 dependent transcriptional regulator [Deltaproteobacteria bacterium]